MAKTSVEIASVSYYVGLKNNEFKTRVGPRLPWVASQL